MKKIFSFFLNFVVRTVLGMGIIFLVNEFFASRGIDIKVGINAVSLLTSGTLGIPGVAALYGILALKFL